MIGSAIKTGQTGRRPRIGAVVWQGTAEITLYGFERVPAALIVTEASETVAVLQYRSEWWDARCIPSREWEDANGDLLGDGDIGQAIDAHLASATAVHEQSARALNAAAAKRDR